MSTSCGTQRQNLTLSASYGTQSGTGCQRYFCSLSLYANWCLEWKVNEDYIIITVIINYNI